MAFLRIEESSELDLFHRRALPMLASKFLGPWSQIVSSQEERMMRGVINSAGLLLLEFPSF